MKDIPGLIRLEKEGGPRNINPDYRLYVAIDSEKITVEKIVIPLENILNETRAKINKHYDEIGSLAPRISNVKPEVIERDSIRGFNYNIPILREVDADIEKIDRKKHELILNYNLWDVPFSIHDVFSPKFGFDGALEAYVDLLAAKKKGERYLPSHIRFDGTLKEMIDILKYFDPDLEMVYKTHIHVRELQILGRKKFMFTKAKEDGLITNYYRLTKKGEEYLKEISPKIHIRSFVSLPFITGMKTKLDVDDFLYDMVRQASLVMLPNDTGESIKSAALKNNLVPDEIYLGIAAYVMDQSLTKGYVKRRGDQIKTMDEKTISTVNKLSGGLK